MNLITKKLAMISFLSFTMFYTKNNIIDVAPISKQPLIVTEVIVVRPRPETEFDCLRKNIYFEAASEGEEGMTAVANVVMNRIHDPDFPKTPCGVVHQYKQFSWYGHQWMPRLTNHTLPMWRLAGDIAKAALRGILPNNVGQCEYFHATTVQPKWADEKEMVIQIGNHIFYKDKIAVATS